LLSRLPASLRGNQPFEDGSTVEAQQQTTAIPDHLSYSEIADGVIRGKLKLSRDQMRMLIEYFPYAMPKLTAIASTTLDSQSFAALLDRAIERSRGARLMIEARPVAQEQSAEELKGPMAKLERY
jgi:hypothetical protein